MRTTKKESMYRRIAAHGANLLAIFPNAKISNPVELCKRLRRREANAARLALAQCNGGPGYIEDDDTLESLYEAILRDVNETLGNDGTVPVFINRDPRGYQLKIDDAWMREHRPALHSDWGGFGIIAPDLTEGD